MKWNESTRCSKLCAIVLFLGVIPAISFYLGIEYSKVIELQNQNSLIVPENLKVVNAVMQDYDLSHSLDYSESRLALINGNIDISGWKTYTDRELGFEFKYPSSCKMAMDPMLGGPNLFIGAGNDKDMCNFSVTYYDNLDEISVSAELPRVSVYDLVKGPDISQVQKINFQGNPAVIGTFNNEGIPAKFENMYIARNGHVYGIMYIISMNGQDRVLDIAKTIQSTFKFIN